MKKVLAIAGITLLTASYSYAVQEVVGAVDGSVKKIDAATKTIVVKTADGSERTFHYAGDLAVHGGKDTAQGSKDALHGLKEGSVVAVHYSAVGGRDVAKEVDDIGVDGLKITKGTVSKVDKAARTISVKTAEGTDETFHVTERAAKDTGKSVMNGVDKSTKVTLYYTEEGGRKTAHFFKEAI
jgi:hypothetical protein